MSCTGCGNSSLPCGGSPSLLRADEQVFEARLEGWRDQQLSRNLNRNTFEDRLQLVRRFQRFTNDWPWHCKPGSEFTCDRCHERVDKIRTPLQRFPNRSPASRVAPLVSARRAPGRQEHSLHLDLRQRSDPVRQYAEGASPDRVPARAVQSAAPGRVTNRS